MREEEKILQTIQTFIESVLLANDVEAALAVVSDNILGVGMNEQGTACDKSQLRRILETQKIRTSAFRLRYPKSDIRYHPPGFATASVVYELNIDTEQGMQRSAFIQTAAARKEEGQWKLCLLQAVPVELTEASIENYPLKFAETTLTQLRGELQEESFQFLSRSLSVGILGAYMEEGDLPPFYVNETMLDMLGYTRAEFFQAMEADSFAVVYPPDRDRVQAELAAAMEKGPEYTSQYRLVTKNGDVLWIVEHGKVSLRAEKSICLSAFVDVSNLMNLQNALEEKNATILSSINYASRLQKNLLPPEQSFRQAFSDYSVLWSPKDIVGGDIYWMRAFEAGTVLCVADCTGHGIPGALLTVLVSTTLDSVVCEDNCRDTARILYEIDRHGWEILHGGAVSGASIMEIMDGCDLAVLFIGKDGSVIFSSAGIPVFLCDGHKVRRLRGQRLSLGEGRLQRPEEAEAIRVPANPDNVFYVATDGLFDQIGGPGAQPFGYREFQRLALDHHGERQERIAGLIWEAFEAYRGDEPRRDDVALLSFRP